MLTPRANKKFDALDGALRHAAEQACERRDAQAFRDALQELAAHVPSGYAPFGFSWQAFIRNAPHALQEACLDIALDALSVPDLPTAFRAEAHTCLKREIMARYSRNSVMTFNTVQARMTRLLADKNILAAKDLAPEILFLSFFHTTRHPYETNRALAGLLRANILPTAQRQAAIAAYCASAQAAQAEKNEALFPALISDLLGEKEKTVLSALSKEVPKTEILALPVFEADAKRFQARPLRQAAARALLAVSPLLFPENDPTSLPLAVAAQIEALPLVLDESALTKQTALTLLSRAASLPGLPALALRATFAACHVCDATAPEAEACLAQGRKALQGWIHDAAADKIALPAISEALIDATLSARSGSVLQRLFFETLQTLPAEAPVLAAWAHNAALLRKTKDEKLISLASVHHKAATDEAYRRDPDTTMQWLLQDLKNAPPQSPLAYAVAGRLLAFSEDSFNSNPETALAAWEQILDRFDATLQPSSLLGVNPALSAAKKIVDHTNAARLQAPTEIQHALDAVIAKKGPLAHDARIARRTFQPRLLQQVRRALSFFTLVP